jgi:SOS-response transcriptional repressor LexA
MDPGIQDGNLLLVDYSKEARPGNVLIALINSEAVIKKYVRQQSCVVLHSTNPKYLDFEIAKTDQFVIAGVVLRVVEGAV